MNTRALTKLFGTALLQILQSNKSNTQQASKKVSEQESSKVQRNDQCDRSQQPALLTYLKALMEVLTYMDKSSLLAIHLVPVF